MSEMALYIVGYDRNLLTEAESLLNVDFRNQYKISRDLGGQINIAER